MHAQSLDDFQWKNRLVLIYDGSEKNNAYTEQVKTLLSDQDGLIERKILLLRVSDNSVSDQNGNIFDKKLLEETTDLRSTSGKFEILLIGLDGGIKLRKSELVSLESLYGLIDRMPMRKAEMQRRKN